jgi:hypothetical protein
MMALKKFHSESVLVVLTVRCGLIRCEQSVQVGLEQSVGIAEGSSDGAENESKKSGS